MGSSYTVDDRLDKIGEKLKDIERGLDDLVIGISYNLHPIIIIDGIDINSDVRCQWIDRMNNMYNNGLPITWNEKN